MPSRWIVLEDGRVLYCSSVRSVNDYMVSVVDPEIFAILECEESITILSHSERRVVAGIQSGNFRQH